MATRTDTDDFNRADANPVSGDWATLVSGDNAQIVGNKVRATATGGGGNTMRWTLPFPANQLSMATLATLTGSGGQIRTAVRISSTAYSYYFVIIGSLGSTLPNLSKYVAGAYTDLGGTSTGTVSIGSTVSCDAQGTTIRVLLDGVQKHSVTDSSLTSGYPGISIFAVSSLSDCEIDDWSATGAGYPVVVNSDPTTAGGTASAAAEIALPQPLRDDTILVAIFRASSAGAIGWPAGWNELADNATDASANQTAIAWKVCLGTEGIKATLSCTSSKFAACVWQIYHAHTSTAPELSTIATGTSTSPNPTAVTPSGGSDDYLILWLGGWEGEQTSPPASVPTNYNDPIGSESGTTGAVTTNVRTAGAWRHVTGTTEDPPAWTISVSDDWTAYAMAVYPYVAPTPGAFKAAWARNTNQLIGVGAR